MFSGKPEETAPADVYYNREAAEKYATSSRIQQIQRQMSQRAIELLGLDETDTGGLFLDIGCGTGLSGSVLSEMGHSWVGVDMSPSMLAVAKETQCQGQLMVQDIGQGLPFRAGTFDGAISISTVQWLCHAFESSHDPRKRLAKFFGDLYAVLARGTRAVLQLYAEDKHQLDLISSAALRAGFTGGIVVDYPNSTKAKKTFLVLMNGPSSRPPPVPVGVDEAPRHARVAQRDNKKSKKGKPRNGVKRRDWVQDKKERRRAQGKKTANDSKYTARRRGPRF